MGAVDPLNGKKGSFSGKKEKEYEREEGERREMGEDKCRKETDNG